MRRGFGAHSLAREFCYNNLSAHTQNRSPPCSEAKKIEGAIKQVVASTEKELAELVAEVEKEASAIDRTIATTLAGLKAARE